jgi:hypothetical protein
VIDEQAELKRKLDELAELERKHHLVGMNITAKDENATLTTLETIDYVLRATRQTVRILARWDEIPLAGIRNR